MKRIVGLTLFVVLLSCVCFSLYGVVAVAETEWVYLGGAPIGIGLAEEGLIVTGIVDVITDEGAVCPARGSEISTGDVIIAVNDEKIFGVRDFASKLQLSSGVVTLTFKRGDDIYIGSFTPVTDSLTGLKKLGLTVKSGINGIGTLTYVEPNLHFGSLGHGIVDADTGKPFLTDQGNIYSCTITGYKRPTDEKAGELIGKFGDHSAPIGKINLCNELGVYGKADEVIVRDGVKIEIAPRTAVRPGKAYIYTTIDGSTPQKYDIEIVKTRDQEHPEEKSMLIKVVDKELIDKTGGILQGMSGSPIVQNDKLVGAVTHVLLNNSTLGYGLYLDWMLDSGRASA